MPLGSEGVLEFVEWESREAFDVCGVCESGGATIWLCGRECALEWWSLDGCLAEVGFGVGIGTGAREAEAYA